VYELVGVEKVTKTILNQLWVWERLSPAFPWFRPRDRISAFHPAL